MNKAAVLRVNLNPQTIICDSETALIPAIQGYFPNTRLNVEQTLEKLQKSNKKLQLASLASYSRSTTQEIDGIILSQTVSTSR
ncbi:Valine--tRNA ligase [Trichinella spiralis]|uniref:Valine--tRNA ligase n=1 Tax=Trichinella spiralis TaxID=6334 RepID=A0ABR3L0I1_TRISP